jgi:asparagine synthetase B (glutamine-hydrolysing)
MSKVLYICFRENGIQEFSEDNIHILSKRLEPDNINFTEPVIIKGKKELITVFNPNDSIDFYNISLCHGKMINPASNWWQPNEPVPDGSFALYRGSEQTVEVTTDIVASKTVWYYFDKDIFISSTSQRAILFFIGSFQFNKAVIPWMLATGSTGPEHSWDKRLKMMKASSSIILDRSAWELKSVEGSSDFKAKYEPEKFHKERLFKALQNTIGQLDLDYSKWVLPLSGGYDSRAILFLLKSRNGLKCITWGIEKSQHQKLNDAYIAKKVAQKLKVDHEYYLTDISNEPVSTIFNRFLICGEGRVDLIGGYMDGFKIWKDLMNAGINGVIRGDEGFGFIHVFSDSDVRMRIGAPELTDYANLEDIHKYGIEKQNIPDWMYKRQGETKETWFDRLYQTYRLPHVIAALNEIKLTYVEVITPLLTKQTIDVVRQLPDKLRYHKKLFRTIVNSLGPKLPYAKYDAINSPADIFNSKEIMDEIISELKLGNSLGTLPAEFIEYLLDHLSAIKEKSGLKNNLFQKNIKSILPEKLKRLLRNTVIKKQMDFRMMAFRAYIISKMVTILTEDSKTLETNLK